MPQASASTPVTTILRRAPSVSAAAAAAPSLPSYFVVMVDLGRLGREAIVDPEVTRRQVIERLVSRDYGDVLFIHEVADGQVSDVTLELQLEASAIVEAA